MEVGHIKKRAKTAIKLVISLALLLFVLSQIDTQKLLHVLKKVDLFWLMIAFITFNLSKIVSSVRLNYYFKDLSISLSEWDALKLYYVGMFYNLFLPGGIGGDGYKIYLLQKRYQVGYKALIQATLLDRLSGLVALVFLTSLLFFYSSFAKLFPPLQVASLLVAIASYPLFLYLHKRLFPRFTTYITTTTLLGLGVQLLQLASAYAIVRALGIEDALIDFLSLFLISSVVAVLPLTIGGIGAREFTFLYGLKLISYDPSLGVVFSFLFFLITLLSSALGIFFLHRPLRDVA